MRISSNIRNNTYCIALLCPALLCTALLCPALPCIALHCLALICIVLLRTPLPYIECKFDTHQTELCLPPHILCKACIFALIVWAILPFLWWILIHGDMLSLTSYDTGYNFPLDIPWLRMWKPSGCGNTLTSYDSADKLCKLRMCTVHGWWWIQLDTPLTERVGTQVVSGRCFLPGHISMDAYRWQDTVSSQSLYKPHCIR